MARIHIDPSKVVRDSFTMPIGDYERIAELKERCIRLGLAMKKSELLRAGLAALDQLPDHALKSVASGVESVKTGRPAGRKKKKKKRKKGDRARRKR